MCYVCDCGSECVNVFICAHLCGTPERLFTVLAGLIPFLGSTFCVV